MSCLWLAADSWFRVGVGELIRVVGVLWRGLWVSVVVEERLLEEVRAVRETLERIEALLEERLIGIVDAEPDEEEAIREYEAEKREGRVELVSLESLIEDQEQDEV